MKLLHRKKNQFQGGFSLLLETMAGHSHGPRMRAMSKPGQNRQ